MVKKEEPSSEDSHSDNDNSTDDGNDNSEDAPYIIFSPSSISVPVEGGTFEVIVTSNVEYVVNISGSWITQTESTDASVLNFVAVANENSGARTSTISLEYDDLSYEIVVTQQSPYIILSQSSADVSLEGETFNIEVSSNVDYTVTISDSWITQPDKSLLSFVAAANETTSARTATITLSWGGLSSILTISQECGSIVVSETSFNLPAEGDKFKLIVTSNVEYSIDIDADWITLAYTSSNSSADTMIFSTSANRSSSERTATISFSWKDAISCSVLVIQEAGSNAEDGGIGDIIIEDW